jgi:hypothetical protein
VPWHLDEFDLQFTVDEYELTTFFLLEGLCECCEMFRTHIGLAEAAFQMPSTFQDVRKSVEALKVGPLKDVPRFTNVFNLAVQWATDEATIEATRKMTEAVEEAEAYARQGRPMQGRNMGGKGSKGKGAGKQGDDASLDQMD